MAPDRHLDWEGCCNARDLGGLPTTDGRTTRRGAVARSERLDELTAAGWSALEAHGIRTIVDLRNHDERRPLGDRCPASVAIVHVPLDDRADTRFWDRWGHLDGTPLFFRPFLDAKPERCAAALEAIANAGPGGVLFHCAGDLPAHLRVVGERAGVQDADPARPDQSDSHVIRPLDAPSRGPGVRV
jgi:hypothetical protein